MTDADIAILRRRIHKGPKGLAEWKELFGIVVSGSGGLLVVGLLIFLVVGLIAKWTAGFNIGWETGYGSEIVWTISIAAFVYVVAIAVMSMRPPRGLEKKVLADLRGARVIVDEYEVVEAKAFQEANHGGLYYFLLTRDERVYVVFDHESQQLAMDGKDPMKSTFAPRTALKLERTPRADVLLNEEMSGSPLPVNEPTPMTSRGQIPKPGEFVDIPWADLEARYRSRSGGRFTVGHDA